MCGDIGVFLSKDLLKPVTNSRIFVGSLSYLTAVLLLFILWKCLHFFQVRNSFWESVFQSPLFWEVIWTVSFKWKPFRGFYTCRMFTSLFCRLEFILVFHTRVQSLQDQEQNREFFSAYMVFLRRNYFINWTANPLCMFCVVFCSFWLVSPIWYWK